MQRAAAQIPFRDGELEVDDSTALSPRSDFGFDEADILAADVIHIHVYDNGVRYRYAGVVDASTGLKADIDDDIEIAGKEAISRFSIIGDGGTATLWITLLTYGIPPE